MRILRHILYTIAAMLASCICYQGNAYSVPPGSVVLYKGGGMGRVEFSGSLHYDEGLVCTDCHLHIFSIRKQPRGTRMSEEDHVPGRFCGACHDSERAFGVNDPESCKKCHSEKK